MVRCGMVQKGEVQYSAVWYVVILPFWMPSFSTGINFSLLQISAWLYLVGVHCFLKKFINSSCIGLSAIYHDISTHVHHDCWSDQCNQHFPFFDVEAWSCLISFVHTVHTKQLWMWSPTKLCNPRKSHSDLVLSLWTTSTLPQPPQLLGITAQTEGSLFLRLSLGRRTCGICLMSGLIHLR